MARAVFTGLVQLQGQLLGRTTRGSGFQLSIRHRFGPLDLGESIAVNGACLTVAAFREGRFEADCSRETATRTTLGQLPIGSMLHLERALRLGDRLGGHIVSGHVDAKSTLVSATREGESLELVFETPKALGPYIAEKGSVTLDGVSLTVTRLSSEGFAVMIIPHSLTETHLGSLRRGDEVNLEVDVLARYVVHASRYGRAEASELAPEPQESDPTRSRDEQLKQALARAGML
jgi:riboflavin synthase